MRTVSWQRCAACVIALCGASLWGTPSCPAAAPKASAQVFRVEDSEPRMEMLQGSTRVLELGAKIKQAQVTNEEVLDLHALSPNQLQVIAKKPGITAVNLWDEQDRLYTVDVTVDADARDLTRVLERMFPDAAVRAIPVQGSVILTGHVNRPDEAENVVRVAELFYKPGGVIDGIEVGGVRQVLLHVKIMEVQRSKLRALGFNFQYFNNKGETVGDFASSIGEMFLENGSPGDVEFFPDVSQISYAIFGPAHTFIGFLEALRRENLLKILAEPDLVAISGRPASFLLGGEFPFQVSQGFGQAPAIEFKPFGTRLDFVAIVLGNGQIRLEVRPEVSEIRTFTESTSSVPGLVLRRVDTAVQLNAGETLAIAGLISTRVTSSTQKLPIMGELPLVGAAFRRVRHEEEEVEMVVLVTPEFVEGMAPQEVPSDYPGSESVNPNDHELFLKGLMEVPVCQKSCCRNGNGGTAQHASQPAEAPNSAPVPVLPRPEAGAQNSPPSSPVKPARAEAVAPKPAPRAKTLRLLGPTGYESP